MILLANILLGLATVLSLLVGLAKFLLFAYIILSWITTFTSLSAYHPVVRVINGAVDPILYFFRRRVNLIFNGVDFSPILAFCLLYLIDIVIVTSLYEYGRLLKLG